MHFLIAYEIAPESRDAAQQRFMEGGGLPPDGVTMHQRWHLAGGLAGFVIAETSDAAAIGRWMQDWTDILTFDVSPILSDEELQGVISG